MSLLRELIPGYENMSEEELEDCLMTGRLGNEAPPPKEKASRKKKEPEITIDIDDYD